MDRDHQTNGDQKPQSLEQPWWLGTAKRQHVLLKFIIICIVIALANRRRDHGSTSLSGFQHGEAVNKYASTRGGRRPEH